MAFVPGPNHRVLRNLPCREPREDAEHEVPAQQSYGRTTARPEWIDRGGIVHLVLVQSGMNQYVPVDNSALKPIGGRR